MKALVSEEHNCVLVSCGMCLLMHVFLDDSLFFFCNSFTQVSCVPLLNDGTDQFC